MLRSPAAMRRATLSFFELPATDPDRLAAFYAAVFDWNAVEVPWDGPRYLRLLPPESGEPPGGGILQREPREAAAEIGEVVLVDRLTVMIRIEGEALESTLERVAAHGGRVLLAPTAIGEFGRFARFLDPEGNCLGLWTARSRADA